VDYDHTTTKRKSIYAHKNGRRIWLWQHIKLMPKATL